MLMNPFALCSLASPCPPHKRFSHRWLPGWGKKKKRLSLLKVKQCPLLSLLTVAARTQAALVMHQLGWGAPQVWYGLLGDKMLPVEWVRTVQLPRSRVLLHVIYDRGNLRFGAVGSAGSIR